ncbi:HdeD family acid-resistance protein [Variovorax terrae]|uniref:HdeD family acid-resistance protein n=1 Tax=Variovorax terrae TaxID=2923278 RepID=A0A9X1VT74_9BURK|nr:HdeD family acid-resistance protein [Variovorax terrae]MCJ0763471.1 HdeD family acid-resistance protein [Variovorax terrae]
MIPSTFPRPLAEQLSRAWWLLLIRGLFAIAFGVFTWLQPGISLAALVLVFGIFVMADGLLGVITAIQGRKENDAWWALLLWGLVGIGVGLITFFAPGITALVLVLYVAAWALATGLLQIVAAVRLRKEIEGEWLLALGGLVSVVFGVLVMIQPGAGALALLWMLAAYAVLFGVLLVVLAFKMRKAMPRAA